MLNEKRSVAVYVRRSPNVNLDQVSLELRKHAKEKNWEIAGEYEDEVLNKAAGLDGLAVLLAEIRNNKIDTVLIYRLDNLGDSLKEAINNIRVIKESKIDLISLMDNISTIDQGKQVFSLFENILTAFKILETRERQKGIRAGLKRAKEKGKKLGRPKIPDKTMEKAQKLRGQGFSFRSIGRLLDMDESTVRKNVRKIDSDLLESLNKTKLKI
jgi:DNA invertase Pin-like site-specific DNA recombinase